MTRLVSDADLMSAYLDHQDRDAAHLAHRTTFRDSSGKFVTSI
ncbi:MAG: hypothetical protein R3C11_22105 [Planctomycetaceae bacterium]